MKRIILALAIALAPIAASAQTAITPTPSHGCATISVTTSSEVINSGNVTLCPGVLAFPASQSGLTMTIINESNSTDYVVLCPFGGTCAAVGLDIAPGGGKTMSVPFITTPPTVIAHSGTQILYLEW